MARYRVTERSFIGNRIVEEGEEVDYDGEASGNLELIEDEPKAKGKSAAKSDDATDKAEPLA